MMSKFYNNAIIGNKNIVASYTKFGELQRLCFPEIDGRQFIDYFRVGVKVNDSNIIFNDYFPEIIETKKYNNCQHKKEEKQEQNDNSNNVVINSSQNQLIQQCFDEMNEIFSYINPEIIPMYPNQSKIDKYDLETY